MSVPLMSQDFVLLLKNVLNKQVLLWHQGISTSLLKDAHMFHLD